MKKKLALITYESIAKERYYRQLSDFFGDKIEIKGYSVKDGELKEWLDADLVLISFADVTNYVKPYVPKSAEITYITRTFTRDNIRMLDELKSYQNVLLVDYSELTAYETLGILHEIGYKNINFTFVYPGAPDMSCNDAEIAVTPGYLECIPPGINKIIDIGWYSISLLTFADIINKLGIFDDDLDEALYKYSQNVIPTNIGLVNAIKHTWEIQNQWNTILDIIDDGVIVMDADNKPVHQNRFIKMLLGDQSWKRSLL